MSIHCKSSKVSGSVDELIQHVVELICYQMHIRFTPPGTKVLKKPPDDVITLLDLDADDLLVCQFSMPGMYTAVRARMWYSVQVRILFISFLAA